MKLCDLSLTLWEQVSFIFPFLYQQSQCKYKFYLDKEHSTQEIEGTRNPDFDHSEMISCKTVTQQVRFFMYFIFHLLFLFV